MEPDSDRYLMLLNYRMTSVERGLSSADILFNRKLKTGLSGLLEVYVRVSGYLWTCRAIDKTKQKYPVWFKAPEAAAASRKWSCACLCWAAVAANSTVVRTCSLAWLWVSSLRCVLGRTRWPSSNPSRQEIQQTGATELKTPRDCSEQGLEQNKTRTIEIKRQKGSRAFFSGSQCNPSLKGMTVWSCVCTPLETAPCHSRRAVPSSHQVHPPSAIGNYLVLTGWCCSLPSQELLIVMAVSAHRKWHFLLFLWSLLCAMENQTLTVIIICFVLHTVASLIYLTLAPFPFLLLHSPPKRKGDSQACHGGWTVSLWTPSG